MKKFFVYHDDDYPGNGGIGLEQFETLKEALAFVEGDAVIVELPTPELIDGLDRRGNPIDWTEVFRKKREVEREHMIRAKFKVTSIKLTEGSKDVLDEAGNPVKDERGYNKRVPCALHTIELYPVYGNGDPKHENTKFWQASPSGKIELGTINPAAAERFEIGREFYIDFTPAG